MTGGKNSAKIFFFFSEDLYKFGKSSHNFIKFARIYGSLDTRAPRTRSDNILVCSFPPEAKKSEEFMAVTIRLADNIFYNTLMSVECLILQYPVLGDQSRLTSGCYISWQ